MVNESVEKEKMAAVAKLRPTYGMLPSPSSRPLLSSLFIHSVLSVLSKVASRRKAVNTKKKKIDAPAMLWRHRHGPVPNSEREKRKGGNRLWRTTFSPSYLQQRRLCAYAHTLPVISFGRGLAFSLHWQHTHSDGCLFRCPSIWLGRVKKKKKMAAISFFKNNRMAPPAIQVKLKKLWGWHSKKGILLLLQIDINKINNGGRNTRPWWKQRNVKCPTDRNGLSSVSDY